MQYLVKMQNQLSVMFTFLGMVGMGIGAMTDAIGAIPWGRCLQQHLQQLL
jgi:hypothetical protein